MDVDWATGRSIYNVSVEPLRPHTEPTGQLLLDLSIIGPIAPIQLSFIKVYIPTFELDADHGTPPYGAVN